MADAISGVMILMLLSASSSELKNSRPTKHDGTSTVIAGLTWGISDVVDFDADDGRSMVLMVKLDVGSVDEFYRKVAASELF